MTISKSRIHTVLFTPGMHGVWGLPMLLTGLPGVGKSSVIEQIGKETGLHVETVIASIREPADFLGLPVPQSDGTVAYAPPRWAERAASAGRAIVFLDEITTCAGATQAGLLRVVNDRVVGDLQLPPGVRILSAANPVSVAASGNDLAPPLANRFGHEELDAPNVSDWIDWMLSGGEDVQKRCNAADEEARVMQAWPNAFAKARGKICGFIHRRPNALFNMPKNLEDPATSKAWASPRTWELATRAVAGAEVHGLNEIDTGMLLAGFVGMAAATELMTWVANADLPDPSELLDGKTTWKHDYSRLDRTLMVLDSCAALVTPEKSEKRNDRAAALWKLIGPIAENDTDVVMPVTRALLKAKLGQMQAAIPVLSKYSKVLQAAGLMQTV